MSKRQHGRSRRTPDRGRAPSHQSKYSAPHSARWVAFQALRSWRDRSVFVGRTLEELFANYDISAADRRLATELTAETVRRQWTIDTILSRFVTRPRAEVEPDVWLLMQLGVCQLVCLPHIPAHAAVHETVGLCDPLRNPRPKGFINGVLRNIERDLISSETVSELTPDDLLPNLLPIAERHGAETDYRLQKFRRTIFDSPQPNVNRHLSQICSLPLWLLDRWHSQGYEAEALLSMGMWFNLPGETALRVNLQQTDRQQVSELLTTAGCTVHPGDLEESLRLEGSVRVADLPGFAQGWFSVQDESAMMATHLLDPQPEERILDLCAAPGGKTTHIAERLGGTGQVLACDVSSDRITSVSENVSRLKLSNVTPVLIGPNGEQLPTGPFDAALVDVPCSNTGVLGKRPEARWRLDKKSVDELVPLQKQLLTTALKQVRPGGRVLYSTCSIDQSENREVVDSVLGQFSSAEIMTEKFHQPGAPADGAYQALINR